MILVNYKFNPVRFWETSEQKLEKFMTTLKANDGFNSTFSVHVGFLGLCIETSVKFEREQAKQNRRRALQ